MVRCRVESDRWPLIADVSNHLIALNPDVPDFQPGKMWKNENQSRKKNKISIFLKNWLFKLVHKEITNNDMGWNHVPTKRKKPTKKKVWLIWKFFEDIFSSI